MVKSKNNPDGQKRVVSVEELAIDVKQFLSKEFFNGYSEFWDLKVHGWKLQDTFVSKMRLDRLCSLYIGWWSKKRVIGYF